MFLKLRIVCTNCGVEKHRDEFYRRTQGGLHRQCKTCIIVQNVARVQADTVPRNAYMRGYLKDVRSGVRRNAAAEFLRAEKAKPCMDCGQCFSPECMQFDHVRGVKVLALGNMKTYGLEKVKAEVAKCELVCSNCHAIRTHQRRQEKPT